MDYITINTPESEHYCNDRFFDLKNCKGGQNLLLPPIKLKEALLKKNFEFHTMDMIPLDKTKYLLFQDIPMDSLITINTFEEVLKYIVKRKWNRDYFYQAIKDNMYEKMFLLMAEPPIINPINYDISYHKYFNKILTWNDDLVDNKKYFKICYPQPAPKNVYNISFSHKKLCVMVASNKGTNYKNQLYFQRRKVIEYFESNRKKFDLYGYDWEIKKNYKGTTNDKLKTLSKYKFCFCYENMCNIKGYITEKIFDCFFANCVPIYWGASNVTDYIPENTFIDYRKFRNIDKVVNYIENMKEEDYNIYLNNIHNFLKSDKFNDNFSIDAYIKTIMDIVLD